MGQQVVGDAAGGIGPQRPLEARPEHAGASAAEAERVDEVGGEAERHHLGHLEEESLAEEDGEVHVDHLAAFHVQENVLGVPVAQIAMTLRSLMAADPVGTLKDEGEVYDIVVRMHTESGLIDEIPNGTTLEDAQEQVLAYVRQRLEELRPWQPA